MDKTAGAKLTEIKNREFLELSTVNAEKIILGLDLSNVPFFAKYNALKLSLAYDTKRRDSVDEIIKKAESGEFQIIERDISEDKSKAYERLIPEVAEILGMSTAQLTLLKNLSKRLVEIYIDNWFADKETIRGNLEKFVDMSYPAHLDRKSHEAEKTVTNDMPEKSEKERQADNEHRQAVIQGDKDHKDKEEAVKKESKAFFFSGRTNVIKNIRSFRAKHDRETVEKVQEEERRRVKP